MQQARDAIRKWLVAMVVQVALMTTLLIAARWLTAELATWYPDSDDWYAVVRGLAWGSAWLVSQPLLFTVPRKLRALAILYAEVFVPPGEGSAGRLPQRRATGRIFLGGLSLLVVWLVAVAFLLRPPWLITTLLVLALAIAARAAWRGCLDFDAVCTRGERD